MCLRKCFLFIFSILFTIEINAQKYDWWINGQLFDGVILAHSEKVKHLIKGRPSGFEINFQKILNGQRDWEKRYNFPLINYGFSYYDLKNDRQLGKLYIASASLDLPLYRARYTNLLFRIGTGLVYSTNPYNRLENNQNTMIGSRFTCLIQTRFTYEIKLNDRLKLTPNLNITHASNGAQSVPNKGINMVTANMGVSYKFIEKDYSINESEIDNYKDLPAYNLKYILLISSGKNTMTAQVREPQWFFNLTAFTQKYLNPKSDLQFGIEYFHNNALKKNIATSWFNRELEKLPDFRRLAVFIGHELKAEKLGFITQLGVYVYNPSKGNMPLYQRYGIKYETLLGLVAQLGLKVHGATAEQIEFGLGWRF